MTNRFLIIIVLLLGTIAGSVLFLWPNYQNIQVIKARVAEQEAKLQNKEAYFANLRKLDQRLQEFEEQIAFVQNVLPNDPQLPGMLESIQGLASVSGLVLDSIKVSLQEPLPDEESKLKTVTALVDLVGTYESFRGFLAQLATLPRLPQVQSIIFKTPTQGTQFTFEVEIVASSY